MNFMKELLSSNKIMEIEDETNKAESTEKVIAKADEFKVILNTETEQVNILDGEKTVRLTMPLIVWKQLTRQ